jgi:hypothetical protein
MTDQQQSTLIQADASDIQQVLLEVDQLADWNPAFLSIDGAATASVGEQYPIRVRGGLRGHFQYDLIRPDRIESSWQVPGFLETNHWELGADADADADDSTVVSHGLTQTGPVAALLRSVNAGVAQLRLDRLKARVEARLA